MEFYDKEYGLEVWGDMACFTRPELKVERVSYDVITPSAARAIFEAIFWKPAIRWEVTRIEVLNPIQWASVRRNEVGAVGSMRSQQIYIEEKRQQRNSLLLKDVRYRIYARLIYIPVNQRKEDLRRETKDENPRKYQAMFERRASKGQCFNQPYLGTREFPAYFRLLEEGEVLPPPLAQDRDLGIMLYDLDFSNPQNVSAMFFRANMQAGVINVPPRNSEEILR
ncbi:type I-C CRISPR-associated protein Cas5c [uncultured Bacteroides sp.]|uniref:type I-C CRISPR-associated protein Cas5c n=1 Tax=uncultured Bacteroides sp. TaxID=162156 RepID=UPI00280AAFD9|nr:type I-C CRISPR-associated protein Cas5c [uncultured Bacteroides sp.]